MKLNLKVARMKNEKRKNNMILQIQMMFSIGFQTSFSLALESEWYKKA